jgi:hypothetical protein
VTGYGRCRLDERIARSNREHVRRAHADAEHSQSLGVDTGLTGEIPHGRAEVLNLCRRVLVAARLAATFASVAGVEHQCRVTKLGQTLGVQGVGACSF